MKIKIDTAPRSAITSGGKLVCGLDGRTMAGRRFADLYRGFRAELGAVDALTPSQEQVVRRAAATSLEVEMAETLRLNGDDLDPETYERLLNNNAMALERFHEMQREVGLSVRLARYSGEAAVA